MAKVSRNLVFTFEFSMINMFPTRNCKKIEEFLLCGTNLDQEEPYQCLEINFTEFSMIGLSPIPNFKKVEGLLIFRSNLGLKGQRYYNLQTCHILLIGLFSIPNFKKIEECSNFGVDLGH